jgi:hypothetical protein
MRGKRGAWIVAVAAVVTLVPIGIAVGRAANQTVPGSRLSCIDWAATSGSVSTTSRTWTDVPGMRVGDRLALNFAVQMSGTFEGNDVELRVLDATVGGTFPLRPGTTSLQVGAVPAGFSFTWVGSNPSEHSHVFRLQWRLPVAGSATLTRGAMTTMYQGAPTAGSC